MRRQQRQYNDWYLGDHLDHIAFPLGGLGAGMFCLEGTGALSHFSVRNRPDVFNEPVVFAALSVQGEQPAARLLEGPVPAWKAFGPTGTGNGGSGKTYGLPRFAQAEFLARFPFAHLRLADPAIPLEVRVTGWSPFTPGDADSSSLPVAALEYTFRNPGSAPVEAVFSFHARNFMATGSGGDSVQAAPAGFVLRQLGAEDKPWEEGAFAVQTDAPDAAVDCAWFRGGWFDVLTMTWKLIADGTSPARPPLTEGDPSPGGSLYVPLRLAPGEERTVRLRFSWWVPETDLRIGTDPDADEAPGAGSCCGSSGEPQLPTHCPWYAGAFEDHAALARHWAEHCDDLRARSADFSECFFDTTLPPAVVEAVAANLSILKSPTVLRQTDGRLWCWEGCCDGTGCCHGSCTHVWNYAQALPHLFPELERSLRWTEFHENQDERGHQVFRAGLPIRPVQHEFHAAADGQLGGIMKVHREWRLSGDTVWLREMWPQVRASLDYCIATWDPDHLGVLVEPHHNTYDIEFWGPDGMCSSFYLGALQAAVAMAAALDESVPLYAELLERGSRYLEEHLFNGEYFLQDIRWQGLRAEDPTQVQSFGAGYSPEARELMQQEGPKYQYGLGCLSDGVLGAWIAEMCGVAPFLNPEQVCSHVESVYRYNFRPDLSAHANPQRPTFALGWEGGLLLCSWPQGGKLSLPFPYSDEVWTGIEWHVASHLFLCGRVEQGLQIVCAARDRYDGRVRNPFNEYECGHWYARALSSYGLLQGLTGARYDAVEKVLYLRPSLPGDFRAFLCTATGYGTVGLRDGEPFLLVRSGRIDLERIELVR